MRVNANTASPACYVMTLDEVKAAAHPSVNAAGTVSWIAGVIEKTYPCR